MRDHMGDCERMGKGGIGRSDAHADGDMGAGTGSWGSLEINACTRRRMGRYCLFHRLVLAVAVGAGVPASTLLNCYRVGL